MKNTYIKNAVLGIALALIAAYLFPAFLLFFFEGPGALLIMFSTIPLYGLYYSFWVVIPLGAALGILIPQIAYGKSRWVAALQGALYGMVAGLVSAFCFATTVLMGTRDPLIVLSVVAYSTLWVGAYAFFRAKGQSLYK
jgi:hypothetical protein